MAIGMHAAARAEIAPGDLAVVIGAGTIGTVTALAALAGGCSRVILADLRQEKLDLVSRLGPIVPVNVQKENLTDAVMRMSDGWGADIVFEASGSAEAAGMIIEPLRPGGQVVYIGSPVEPVPINISYANTKEACIKTIFRYANMYPRAIALLASGRIDLKPLITDTYRFEDSIAAFEYARSPKPSSVKVQIVLAQEGTA